MPSSSDLGQCVSSCHSLGVEDLCTPGVSCALGALRSAPGAVWIVELWEPMTVACYFIALRVTPLFSSFRCVASSCAPASPMFIHGSHPVASSHAPCVSLCPAPGAGVLPHLGVSRALGALCSVLGLRSGGCRPLEAIIVSCSPSGFGVGSLLRLGIGASRCEE